MMLSGTFFSRFPDKQENISVFNSQHHFTIFMVNKIFPDTNMFLFHAPIVSTNEKLTESIMANTIEKMYFASLHKGSVLLKCFQLCIDTILYIHEKFEPPLGKTNKRKQRRKQMRKQRRRSALR